MMTRTGRTGPPCPSPPLDMHAPVHLRVALTVDGGSEHGATDIRSCTKQLPELVSLPPGAWIAVELAPQRRGLFARALRRPKHQRLRLATCCTALLAAGYERICVDEHERAFGRVPLR
jgi:hypothetical protein